MWIGITLAQARTDPESEHPPAKRDDAPVQPGDVLAGKYRVERVLGSGGMGVVVAAEHIELGQRVALKFLLPHARHLGETHSRFLREAKAAVQIESEHVARVLDFGRLESGAPYLVMEYLDGEDLSTRIDGPQPIGDAVDFVLQASAAMAVAHSLGIIHRDLKPGNLFVTRRPDGSPLVKVLDFGISKLSLLDTSVALTHSSTIMGSPRYMSPEQARNAGSVDARTDLWSLGAILYELLTGVPPFQGNSLTEVLTLLVTADPEPIRSYRPDVPPGLEQAVLKALEKPLERRYANIAEFSAALVEFAPRRSWVLHDQVSGVLARAGISAPPPSPETLEPSSRTIVPPALTPELEAQATLRQPRPEAPRSSPQAPPRKRLPTGVLLGAGGLTLAGLAFALGYQTAPLSPPPAPAARLPEPARVAPARANVMKVASVAEVRTEPPAPAHRTSSELPSAAAGAASPSSRSVRARPASSPRTTATSMRRAISGAVEATELAPLLPPRSGTQPVVKKPPRSLDADNPFDGK